MTVVTHVGNGVNLLVDPITLGKPLPTKIAIVGFADSKDEAPFNDPTWEIWGVNDLYAHVPRVDRSFELHDLNGLGQRRNPGYEAWLKEGKTPVYSFNPRPEYPGMIGFPEQAVRSAFGEYFTNSISWMTALALLCLTQIDDKGTMTARPDVELALFGVDMAHETEYGAQRPSCEYYIGIARALGVKVYIPATSDLLKAGALYGKETTSPQRIKMMKRIESLNKSHNDLAMQEQQLQVQVQSIQASRNQIKGAIGMAKYVMGVWTMPTEIAPDKPGDKERKLPNGNGTMVNDNGALDVTKLLKEFDIEEAANG